MQAGRQGHTHQPCTAVHTHRSISLWSRECIQEEISSGRVTLWMGGQGRSVHATLQVMWACRGAWKPAANRLCLFVLLSTCCRCCHRCVMAWCLSLLSCVRRAHHLMTAGSRASSAWSSRWVHHKVGHSAPWLLLASGGVKLCVAGPSADTMHCLEAVLTSLSCSVLVCPPVPGQAV
jgi:hypothetical protein